MSLDAFVAEATTWLDEHAERSSDDDADEFAWNKGEFSVAVFHALSEDARAGAARADPARGRS